MTFEATLFNFSIYELPSVCVLDWLAIVFGDGNKGPYYRTFDGVLVDGNGNRYYEL